jgi:hypothetical protein
MAPAPGREKWPRHSEGPNGRASGKAPIREESVGDGITPFPRVFL